MRLAGFKTLLLDIEQLRIKSAVSNKWEMLTDINEITLDKTFFNIKKGGFEDKFSLGRIIDKVSSDYKMVFGNNVKKAVVNVPTFGTNEDAKMLRELLTRHYRKPYFIHTSEAVTYGEGLGSALVVEASCFSVVSTVINNKLMSKEYYEGYAGINKSIKRLGIDFKEALKGELFEDTQGLPYIIKRLLFNTGITERQSLMNNMLLTGPLVYEKDFYEFFNQYLEEVIGIEVTNPPSIIDTDAVIKGLFQYSKKF